jgi:tRNA dimethylallyltransferase
MQNDLLPTCIALAGPTASGKTAAALAIAQRWPVEIISVDSALVYCGMDIGTAKPTPDELAAVPHHLIDIRDPLNAYSAAEFVLDAKRLMREITARGRRPLLVGGTMLYFKALMHGIDDMPKADPAVRALIAMEAQTKGWPAMHAELAKVDTVTAARLQPQDSQRISRALEVFRISGQPLSFFQTRNVAKNATENATKSVAGHAHKQGATADIDFNFRLISLEPIERSWLHARIAARFDAMLAAGFMNEVKGLRARGDLHLDLPSMRCVGYRQAWQALDGDFAMHELRDIGIFATRQLAKRQITWLRSMPERYVVACDAPDALEQVLALVSKAQA